MNTLPVTRRLVCVLAGVLALALTSCSSANDFSRGFDEGLQEGMNPTTAATPPTLPANAVGTSTAKPVIDVVLPEVKGRNGKIVYDELAKLGLTDVSYASRDADDTVVINPANWTAVRIEPKVGTTVKSDATVVVTMTKK